jgi:hypothetical protein
MLILSALFFAVTSILELREFYRQVAHEALDLQREFARFEEAAPPAVRSSEEYLRFRVLSLLEADALQRRYRQANATMLARVWTRHLGFTTGMIVAMVGAAFILGQLREDPTTVEFGSDGLKGALVTSSPGIVLAALGTVLMAVTIWVPFDVETRDLNIYLRSAPVAVLPPPGQELPEEISEARVGDGGAAIDAREERLFGREAGAATDEERR